MGEDRFQEMFDFESVPVVLPVENVVPGDRRAVEVVGEHPPVQGEVFEPRGIDTEDERLSPVGAETLQFADPPRPVARNRLTRISVVHRRYRSQYIPPGERCVAVASGNGLEAFCICYQNHAPISRYNLLSNPLHTHDLFWYAR